MAETLGMLCDKLTIVKLKEYHTEDPARLANLAVQSKQLQEEIDEYLAMALAGKIPIERMSFASNKVYKREGNEVNEVSGNLGEVFYQLANVNCMLWHEQEKVYEFDLVAPEQKDVVVKQLAILNLERNACIDSINNTLKDMVRQRINLPDNE